MTKHPLTEFRKAKGLKQPELARLLHVNKSTILRWERGDMTISQAKWNLIERVTGIPRSKLRPDIFTKGAA